MPPSAAKAITPARPGISVPVIMGATAEHKFRVSSLKDLMAGGFVR